VDPPLGPATGPVPEARKKRQQRVMLAIAGGGLLALIFLLQRRATGQPVDAAAAPAMSQPYDASMAPVAPSTFADNGAASADALTYVGQALDNLTTTIADREAPAPATGPTSGSAQELLAIASLWQVIFGPGQQPNNPAARKKPPAQKKPKPKPKPKPKKKKPKPGLSHRPTGGAVGPPASK
jgi:hypothetical protein